MSVHNLDKIFQPSSVAVIGASEKERSIGCALIENLRRGGFRGKVYPVNPHYRKIKDLPAYASVGDIGHPVDLAVIATPISTVASTIRECAGAGVGGAVVISAGGKEIGKQGRNLEEEIKREAYKAGIRMVGPNCAGLSCSASGLHANFGSDIPLPGKLAFISQSGALGGAVLDFSLKKRIGFSHFVSVGSMLDVDFGDLIDYLGNDPEVSSILLYMESVTNTRKFMSAARAVSRMKPIVVLKSGRSAAGARAAASHTGAVAGEDAVYDAAFRRAGMVRVNTIEELFDCAELMAKQPVPKGPALTIITNAGGPGVMASDAVSAFGLDPAPLGPETIGKLNEFLPPFWSHGNPVDILGDATAERYRRAVEVCVSAQESDGLIVIFVPQAVSEAAVVAASLVDAIQGRRYPIFAVWMGGEGVEPGREILNRANIATYETPERAVQAFMYMYSYAHNLELLQQTPPRIPHALEFDRIKAKSVIDECLKSEHQLLTEAESKVVLSAYGIPVNRTEVATSPDEATSVAREVGYPVAMKVYSRDIAHKSDANGVHLNLRNDEDVREAFKHVTAAARLYKPEAKVLGVTIQSMLRRPDYELIMGSKSDADFGPIMLFGMGGIMTEILRDHAIALPPLNRLLARRLMESTRVYCLLKGYRNRPPANRELLEEILIRLAQLITDFPEIIELDINPLVVLEDTICAVDARIILKTSNSRPPDHLVISPYPNQYETTVITNRGVEVFIRPIKPEDEPLLVDSFHTLSPTSIRLRFFSAMKELPHKMLARLTQIDYDRDVVLVAPKQGGGNEGIIGVCRLMNVRGTEEAEFAVVVSDAWQGKGIGAKLMERCIAIAKEREIDFLTGVVLAENRIMMSLARKFGFQITRRAGTSEYDMRLDLKAIVGKASEQDARSPG